MLRRTNLAEHQLAELTGEINGRYAVTRRHPESLDELGWRLYAIFEDGNPIDPWGRPWRYGTPGSNGRPYDLGSHGRDGVPSSDDIGHPPRPR